MSTRTDRLVYIVGIMCISVLVYYINILVYLNLDYIFYAVRPGTPTRHAHPVAVLQRTAPHCSD